jgi:hypothetical protein
MTPKVIEECALCKYVRELRESHFLPSAVYKNMKVPGDTSQVILDRKRSRIEKKQIRTHLLCAECEDTFNKNGEAWVMGHGFHATGTFPLQNALKAAKPVAETDDGWAFSGVGVPDVRMDPLTYFAASVFWRASVHDWRCEEYRLHFGDGYQEQFRQYLLGQASFPCNAALIIDVFDATERLEIGCQNLLVVSPPTFPYGGKVEGRYCKYEFDIPGVHFALFLGQRIPEAARRLCAVHSHERWIFLSTKAKAVSMTLDMMSDYVRMRRNGS